MALTFSIGICYPEEKGEEKMQYHFAVCNDRETDAVQIVFITGYSDYIAQRYEVAALHYL